MIHYDESHKAYEKDDKFAILLNYFEGAVHDIKTPVSIVLSILQSLESQGALPLSTMEQIFKIKKYCFKMLKQINDITDYSKISGGHFSPRYVNYNIIFLAESITHSILPLASRKDINIVFDTNQDEKIMAVDKNIFERILLNLLSNAIKFAPNDSVIYVKVCVRKTIVSIDVIDSGCGISEERLELIFDRYETTKGVGNEPGAGVGLNVVKELLAAINASIKVKQSSKDKGTIMHIELPVFVLDDADECFDYDSQETDIMQIGLPNNGEDDSY